jgi:hypothetical protein
LEASCGRSGYGHAWHTAPQFCGVAIVNAVPYRRRRGIEKAGVHRVTLCTPPERTPTGGVGWRCNIVQNDRYPLSPRIVVLREIIAKLRPEPARPAPLPPRRHYEPPSKGRYRRRRLASGRPPQAGLYFVLDDEV